MAWLNTSIMDNGLSWLKTNGVRLDICSDEPTSFAEVATYTLGNRIVSMTGPFNLLSGGRKVTVPTSAIGTVSGDGTASYWAITDDDSILIATGVFDEAKAVESGNSFIINEFDIGIPGPV